VVEALLWGALAASSLVIGALLGVARQWSSRPVGLVLGFGAGALISAVSFELFEEGVTVGGAAAVGGGLAAGALTYYAADSLIARTGAGRSRERRSEASGAGSALALGAFLDGIPEQTVLGLGLATGEPVSVGLLGAVFVSNLPEAIGSATTMREAGTRPAAIRRLWGLIAVGCAIATPVGFAIADVTGGNLQAGINGFAAGALLVMLIDSMIPEARSKAGRAGGVVTVLGFAVAMALSNVG
jgi:zinc transporter, ZIP family